MTEADLCKMNTFSIEIIGTAKAVASFISFMVSGSKNYQDLEIEVDKVNPEKVKASICGLFMKTPRIFGKYRSPIFNQAEKLGLVRIDFSSLVIGLDTGKYMFMVRQDDGTYKSYDTFKE